MKKCLFYTFLLISVIAGCTKTSIKLKNSTQKDSVITKDTSGGTSTHTLDTGWHQVASLPGARAYATGFSINNLGYVGGGVLDINGVGYTDMYMYNPTKNTWTKKAWLPSVSTYDTQSARYGCFSFVINNTAYAGGGNSDAGAGRDVEVYDTVADKWTLVAKLNNPHEFGISYATSWQHDGYIFVYDNAVYSNYLWKFDATTNSLADNGLTFGVGLSLGDIWLGSKDSLLFVGEGSFLGLDLTNNNTFNFPNPQYNDGNLYPKGSVVTKNATYYNGCIYVSFGDAGHLYRFDFKTNLWNNISFKNLNVTEGVSTFLIGSKLYMVGGNNGLLSVSSANVWVIDLNAYK